MSFRSAHDVCQRQKQLAGPMAAGGGLIPQHGPFKQLAKARSPVREKPLHCLDSTCWDATMTKRRLVQQQRRSL